VIRQAVVALTLLSFTACTTMQPVRDFTPSKIFEEVDVGDRAIVYATNKQTYDIRVSRIEADALYGYTHDRAHHYKIPFESIQSIKVEKVSAWKIFTGFGAVVTIGVIAFIYAIIKALDDSQSSGGGWDWD
jgi:hypothetical protein